MKIYIHYVKIIFTITLATSRFKWG